MANVSVLNTTANLSGKTVAVVENNHTISGSWTFGSNLLFTDATYDIGASGATRPRDLFLSRNATLGGTLGVTGVATFTAQSVHNAGISIAGASAGQLVFPAAQNASAGANTLDDYEEGTFTPTIASAGGGTPTYSAQLGWYVKVGRLVCFAVDVTLATKGTLGAGQVQVNGLPFTAGPGTSVPSAVSIGYFSAMSTSVVNLLLHVIDATTRMDLYHIAAAATAPSATAVSDIGTTFRIMAAGNYFASE